MMKFRLGLGLALGLALGGCSLLPTAANVTAATTATISAAQAKLQDAITLYGIAKGMAQVAGDVNPAVGAVAGPVIALVDPLIVKAQAALNDATVDAQAIEDLASSITSQANALTRASAPSITVIPSGT